MVAVKLAAAEMVRVGPRSVMMTTILAVIVVRVMRPHSVVSMEVAVTVVMGLLRPTTVMHRAVLLVEHWKMFEIVVVVVVFRPTAVMFGEVGLVKNWTVMKRRRPTAVSVRVVVVE